MKPYFRLYVMKYSSRVLEGSLPFSLNFPKYNKSDIVQNCRDFLSLPFYPPLGFQNFCSLHFSKFLKFWIPQKGDMILCKSEQNVAKTKKKREKFHYILSLITVLQVLLFLSTKLSWWYKGHFWNIYYFSYQRGPQSQLPVLLYFFNR